VTGLLGILKKQNKRTINVRIRKKILTHLQPVLLFKDSCTDRKGRAFTDSYWRILKLALPVGLEGVFQTSFSLIDQIVVGRLGADAVAGVGLSNSISFIVLLFYSEYSYSLPLNEPVHRPRFLDGPGGGPRPVGLLAANLDSEAKEAAQIYSRHCR